MSWMDWKGNAAKSSIALNGANAGAASAAIANTWVIQCKVTVYEPVMN